MIRNVEYADRKKLQKTYLDGLRRYKCRGIPIIIDGGECPEKDWERIFEMSEDGGFYNVNADMVAGHIAAAIGAHKVVFLTDVDGLYENFENKDSLISNLTLFEAQYMVENNIVSTGMIPKLKSCIHALDSGVFRAHIINGITPHSLLLELLTSTGVGTTMHSTEESCTFDTHPLGNFASKLLENRQHAASATPNNKIF